MKALLACGVLFYAVCAWHVLHAPFTKVEESFNLQAAHDVLHHGLSRRALGRYDHLVCTGPVPRTFIGALALSGASWPLIRLASAFGWLRSKFDEQIIVRLALAAVNSAAVTYFFACARPAFGAAATAGALLLSAAQFHVPFYAGRTLPNFFAFPLVMIALGSFVASLRRPASPRAEAKAVRAGMLLVAAAMVFRLELLALLGPLALAGLVARSVHISKVVMYGMMSAMLAGAATFVVDSYFWQRRTWPEAESMLFNVVEGKMEDWGVMPFHYYFTNSLPKLLGLAYPFALLGLVANRQTFGLGVPSLVYVGAMSLLKHKEWRFVVYVVPGLNLCAARAYYGLCSRLAIPKPLRWIGFAGLVLSALGYTAVSSAAARLNYPGGVALLDLHSRFSNASNLNVHLDNLVTQTGASRFLQLRDSATTPVGAWTYDKAENLTTAADFAPFDIILAEALTPAHAAAGFSRLAGTPAFSRLRLRRPALGRGDGSAGPWERLAPCAVEVNENAVVTLRRKQG